jgi:MSHA biogenesis protein MshQ
MARSNWRLHFFIGMLVAFVLSGLLPVWSQSQTYLNGSTTYDWIDSTNHNRIRAYSPTYNYAGFGLGSSFTFPRATAPFFFYTPSGSTCGTTGTVIDDRLTDEIPLGFTFNYGGINFTTVRVMTNGRLQFNNNVTCGFGTDNSGLTIYPYDYPDGSMNYSMRIYGADLDPTPKNFKDGSVTTAVNAAYPTVCLDDASCYVSYATIGSAPARKFVVTWNNVPKWVNAGVIAGNFNLQIVLEEGGEFVFQFGNVNDTQANVPAQIGWQVNSNDYDIKQTALPTNFSAIRYRKPRPVAQFQMEQTSWSTAAGQVLDTSGNSRNGTRLGAGQTINGGYSCLGANIPANTTSTRDGIDTGINVSNDLIVGGLGSISFWYKPVQWSGGGAVPAMLFDASNANNGWFYLAKLVSGSNSRLRFAIRDSTGTTRSVETANFSVASNSWVHIAVSWNFNTLPAANSDRMRIYINGQAIGSGSSVQSTFTTAGSLGSGIDTLTLGDNRSSFVDGSNGTLNSANGVIDEVRVFNEEIGLGQVLADFSSSTGCANHYAITHDGSGGSPTNGTTCRFNQVAIAMHTAADVNIATSTTINITTSTGRGDWTLVSGFGVLNNGAADDGAATYQFSNESQVVLALTYTIPGTLNINVSDGLYVEKAGAEDANLTIISCSAAGFNGCEFAASRCTAGATDYDQLFTKLAGRAFRLDALRLNTSGGLESTFNGTVSVDLLANTSVQTSFSSATNCPTSHTAVIPLGSVTFTAGRLASAPLSISATALASVAPNYSAYRDVRMRFTCSTFNCPPAGVTACSRDGFAVRPTDLLLSASSMTNASATSGTPSQIAGTAFAMTAQAQTASTATAPGYNGTPQITATTAAQSAASHISLTDYTDKLKDVNANNVAAFGTANLASGLASGSFYYLDYGGFRVLAGGARDAAFVDSTVDVPGKDCDAGSASNTDSDADSNRERFGCVVANQSNSALVGRFYPNNFLLQNSSMAQGCLAGAFTYQGQPWAVNATVSTLSSGTGGVASAVMTRYPGGTVSFAAENNNNGTDLSTRLSGLSAGTWGTPGSAQGGVYSLSAANVIFSRPAATPDGPFEALDIGIRVLDPVDSSVTLGATRNMLPTDATTCTSITCTHQKLAGSPIKMRYGRLSLKNSLGSERLDLPMSLTAQYWSGSAFSQNSLDSCTTVTAANISRVNQQGPVTAANVTVSNVANSGVLINGSGLITLSRPTPLPSPWTNVGGLDLILNLGATGATLTCPLATPPTPLGSSTSANLGYLANNTCGAAAYDRNPTARATFGVYKSPLIYRRENY